MTSREIVDNIKPISLTVPNFSSCFCFVVLCLGKKDVCSSCHRMARRVTSHFWKRPDRGTYENNSGA